MIYNTIVLGGGPAGIAAAIQLKRSGVNPLILEKNKIGGLVHNAYCIENYPGFPYGISGKQLAGLFKKQLEGHAISTNIQAVVSVEKCQNIFLLKTKNRTIRSYSLIISTGTVPKQLDVSGERMLAGKRLFYEIEALPKLTKKDTVIVIGSGDIAFDFAVQLASRRIKTTIFFRNDAPRCIRSLFERVMKNPHITIYQNASVTELRHEGSKVKIRVQINNKIVFFASDYLLVAIGRTPQLECLPVAWQELLEKDHCALENIGLCVAGDARSRNFRHVGIAVGDGLRAAMVITRFLSCQ